MVKKNQKPYTVTVKRKGKIYQYFRRGKTYIRLPNNLQSEKYDEEYWAIRNGSANLLTKTTYNILIQSYYRSSDFITKKASTHKEYRRTLEAIREKNGDLDFTKLKRSQVIAARDKYADTWRKANAYVEMLSILSRHAIDLKWIINNPARGVKKFKTKDGYMPWPKAKQNAYILYCEKNGLDLELLAFHLGTGTGQRVSDLIKMKWVHFQDGYMDVVQDKTNSRIWVYCPSTLQNALFKTKKQGDYILSTGLRTHIAKRALQKKVENIRKKINATDYVIHGWRYTAAIELAEAGCSDSEIQSVTGHKTLEMVQKYRNQANQRRLSKAAQQKRDY